MMKVKSIRALVDAARHFKANPDMAFEITGLWPPERWTLVTFRRWFLRCLHNKINRHDSHPWRKLDYGYQSDLCHDASIINDYARGMMHRGLNLLRTPELRRRYPHVNNNIIDGPEL